MRGFNIGPRLSGQRHASMSQACDLMLPVPVVRILVPADRANHETYWRPHGKGTSRPRNGNPSSEAGPGATTYVVSCTESLCHQASLSVCVAPSARGLGSEFDRGHWPVARIASAIICLQGMCQLIGLLDGDEISESPAEAGQRTRAAHTHRRR